MKAMQGYKSLTDIKAEEPDLFLCVVSLYLFSFVDLLLKSGFPNILYLYEEFALFAAETIPDGFDVLLRDHQ